MLFVRSAPARLWRSGLLVAAAGLAACGTLPKPRPETWWTSDAAGQALLEADAAFAARSVARGAVDAFTAYSARDVVNLPASTPATATLDALLARLATMGDTVLTWQVARAEVARSGEKGFTYGMWQLRRHRADGAIQSQGRYVTVWHRQPDGAWKAAVDIANTEGGGAGFPPLAPERLRLRLDPRVEPGDR